jgi:hypothetical protein
MIAPTGINNRGSIVYPTGQHVTPSQPQLTAKNVPTQGYGNYQNAMGYSSYTPPVKVDQVAQNQLGSINGINYGSSPSGAANAQNVDDIIKSSLPFAKDILNAGTGSAIDLARQGTAQSEQRMRGFLNPRALEEQANLLGVNGQQAQQAAISNLPISAAQQELDRRERVGFNRMAAARGELGGGATLLGAGQIAGQQQQNRIGGRINELEQLAGIDRQLLSDAARQRESAESRVAALQGGLGTQIANVGLGLTAPVVESMQTQADIQGLRGIASANASAQRAGQVANLAGQVFSPQNIQAVGNYFNRPPDTQHITTSASGASANTNYGNYA